MSKQIYKVEFSIDGLSLAEQNIPKAQIARMFKVDRGTIRRFIKENKDV